MSHEVAQLAALLEETARALGLAGIVARIAGFRAALGDPPVVLDDLATQIGEWSLDTFGPGARTERHLAHIRKELDEIAKAPTDLEEWIDVIVLAIGGAFRAGHGGRAIAKALAAKHAKNVARKWPDWRTVPEDKPIEHVRNAFADVPHPEPAGDRKVPSYEAHPALAAERVVVTVAGAPIKLGDIPESVSFSEPVAYSLAIGDRVEVTEPHTGTTRLGRVTGLDQVAVDVGGVTLAFAPGDVRGVA